MNSQEHFPFTSFLIDVISNLSKDKNPEDIQVKQFVP